MSEPSNDQLKNMGLLTHRREELRRLANRVRGIKGSLSDATFTRDPFEPWELDGDRICDYARELKEALQHGRKLREIIANLESEVGNH